MENIVIDTVQTKDGYTICVKDEKDQIIATEAIDFRWLERALNEISKIFQN